MVTSGPPLRVLYSFPHTLGAPGIGTTALHQVLGLMEQGCDVTVSCTSSRVPLDTTTIQTLLVAGRRIPHRVLGMRRAYGRHDRHTARLLGENRFDVVHGWPPACLETFAAARQAGTLSFREMPSPHTAVAFERASAEASRFGVQLPRKHSHRPDPAKLRREIAEYAAADVLLAPSDFVVRSLVEQGIDPVHIARHRYGADLAGFSPGQTDARDRAFTAVFVGRGEPNKGLHYALMAWLSSGAAKRGRFVICGQVLPAYQQVLGHMLGDESVDVLGFVSDVGAVLRNADVLLLPTVTEGSALVTYEAMASGCVPLVSDAAGAPCEHGRDGLLHATGDVAELTDQLRLLSSDRQLLEALRQGALARRDELSWGAAGRRLVEVYREVLEAPPSRSGMSRPALAA